MSKFTVAAFRAIKRKPFVELPKTTLYTARGPAVGTMWLDIQHGGKTRRTKTIQSVTNGEINYVEGGFDTVAGFHACVESGRYALVGVQQPILQYSPTVFS